MTTTTDHTIDTVDGPMRLYEARPDGEPRGAVIVIMEAFGVNDHIEDVTRRAADAGYLAVAPDLFHRAGGGSAAYDDFGTVMQKFAGLTDEGILADVDATLAHLAAAGIGPSSTGIVGFCFGGRVTFLVSARRALGAGVGFYGGGIVNAGVLPFPALVGEAGGLQTPWLGLFGDLDAMIPVDDVERLRSELAAAPVATEVVRYADADHGFHCDGRPAVFHADAAKDAWSRTLAWFAIHL
ncbi:MAG: dienelactone hydrolase family protein [Acidimicrobiales bacterium]|nr:dienelactone hydrolase family protein [Acidimicrobiales bacterium]